MVAATRPSELNRKQRKALARRLRVEDPGLDVVHPHAAGIDIGSSGRELAFRVFDLDVGAVTESR